MRRTTVLLLVTSALLAVNGEEHMSHSGMDTGHDRMKGPMITVNGTHGMLNLTTDEYESYKLYQMPSYASLTSYNRYMLAHIVLMTLAWFFVLPAGVMFSIARSKLTLPVQLLFLTLNAVGVIVSIAYDAATPDLYANNAHHKIGWIATWIVTAHVVMNILFMYAGRGSQNEMTKFDEHASFLPATLESLRGRASHKYTWSEDSGHGAEPTSPSSSSRHHSPSRMSHETDATRVDEDDDQLEEIPMVLPKRRSSWFESFQNTKLDHMLSTKVPQIATQKVLKIAGTIYDITDRLVLILASIAIITGWVTYSGILRGNHIFNGLAHFIKGGIFFWYGLLTLGRWLGCFADLGWAWNLKPTASEVGSWKASLPTAEFTESFVIFLYGSTNVFLEHLAAWGGAWTAQDFEHVSISIMFFGGGLAGMLIESKMVRRWLNTNIDMMPTRIEAHAEEAHEVKQEPKTYTTSLNIMPALIIFLLGIMMSSHHQASMVSTMVHTQWGTLLCGFSVFRGLTYVINYLAPPKSIYPARPPTELAASFCLISGGLVFMASTKDIIHYMEEYNLMAMFIFTVIMGFTAFLMAYETLIVSLKGWATRRQNRVTHFEKY